MSALEGFEGPPPDPNRLRVEREEDTHYVRLAGEFDEFLQQATDAALHGLPEKGSKDAVVIDMRLVTFVDSLGLRVLLKHEARSTSSRWRPVRRWSRLSTTCRASSTPQPRTDRS